MKSKVEQYAKGDFYVEYPEVKFSKNYLQLKIEAGSVYTGRIGAVSENGIPMKMMVYDDSYLLSFEDHGLIGQRGEIVFTFDAAGRKRGSVYEGTIHVIGNGTEESIPYNIEIVAPFFHVNGTALEDLMKYCALAEADWEKAREVFWSDSFAKALLAEHGDYREIYHSLRHSEDRDQAMEEFLVYIHKKRALTLQWEHDRFQFHFPKMREQHPISLRKNTWGYCRMRIRTDVDFIRLEQTEICSMDFDGDRAEITYTLDPSRMNPEENAVGHIILENASQRVTASVTVRKNEEPSRILVQTDHTSLACKREMAELVHGYLDYRIGRVGLSDFIERTRASLKALIGYQPEIHAYRLGLLHMSVLGGQEEIAREELRRMEADMGECMQEPRERCYYLYLKGLICQDASKVIEARRQIETALMTETDKIYYFWLLIQADDNYHGNPPRLYSKIETLFFEGYRSPVLEQELCELLNTDPLLLRRLSPLELAAIRFGLRNQCLEPQTQEVFLQLVEKEKEFRQQIFSLLCAMYEKEKKPEMIRLICGMLIKGGRLENRYHAYYLEGIKCGHRLVGIQENYLRSIDRTGYELIPESVLRYFNFRGLLSDAEYAYLYANVIVNRRRYLGQYDEYVPNMEAFMEEQILKGNISDDLSILYSEFLTPETVKQNVVPRLTGLVFKRKLTVMNDNIASVVISHRELSRELEVAVENHVAYVDLITESAVIALVDRQGNRYVSTIPYKLQKLVEEDQYMDLIRQYAGDDFRYALYQYHQLEAHDATTAKEVNAARDLLAYPEISEDTRQEAVYAIVRYYYQHLDLHILASYLERMDMAYVPADGAAGFINYLLSCGKYDRAYEAVKRFGYQGVQVPLLIGFVEHLKEFSQFAGEETLLSVAVYLYRMGQDTPEILSYLTDYFQGGLKDMLKLWKRAEGRLSGLDMLEENIICETLYTEQWHEEVYRVFASYVRKKRTGMVVKAFFKRAAFAYLIEEKEIPASFFEALFFQMSQERLQDDICRGAMLLFLSAKPRLERDEAEWVRKQLGDFLKRGILLPFFRSFKKYMMLPEELFLMTYVVTRDRAGKRIWIRYGIQSGVEKPECSKKARMMEVLPGYYMKEFVLFHGENLLYELPEENMGRTSVYESGSMQSKANVGEYGNRFEMINAMLLDQELGDNVRLIDKISTYLNLAAIVEENLELMQ